MSVVRNFGSAGSGLGRQPELRPWTERYQVVLQGALFAGFGLVSWIAIGSDHPAVASAIVLAVWVMILAAFVVWSRLRWRRVIARFRDDPNVVWAGVAGVDRVELVQAKIEPMPPRGYGLRRTVVLLTRDGVAFRPLQDRWDWQGADVSARRVQAVTLGTVRRTRQAWPAIRLLVPPAQIVITLRRIDNELKEALVASPLGHAILDKQQFDDQAPPLPVLTEDGAGSPEPQSPIGRLLSARSDALRKHRLRTALLYSGGMIGGSITGAVGSAAKQIVVMVLGLVLALGVFALFAAVIVYEVYQAEQRRTRREYET